jgi:hypothetical protein
MGCTTKVRSTIVTIGALVYHDDRGSVRPVRISSTAFSWAIVLWLVPSLAYADPVRRTEIEAALSSFEGEPAVADVRAWGPQGRTFLLELARDPRAFAHVRTRAVHALRAFEGDAAARQFLRDTAAFPAQELFMLRAALDALIEGFGDVAAVARFLNDPRVEVRDGAAWSLARSRDPAARAALTAQLRVEADPTVRDTLTRALGDASPTTSAVVAAPPASVATSIVAAPRVRRTRGR